MPLVGLRKMLSAMIICLSELAKILELEKRPYETRWRSARFLMAWGSFGMATIGYSKHCPSLSWLYQCFWRMPWQKSAKRWQKLRNLKRKIVSQPTYDPSLRAIKESNATRRDSGLILRGRRRPRCLEFSHQQKDTYLGTWKP